MSFEQPAPDHEKKPVEVERKFSIDPDKIPHDLEPTHEQHLRQGYLAIADDGSETRVRSTDDEQFELTVKSKGTLVRGEETIEITDAMFSALYAQTEGARVEKTRLSIPHEGHVIELDLYEGALTGLATAEVEFHGDDAIADAESFVAPEWFGDDVTEDKAYKNQTLATKGLPQ